MNRPLAGVLARPLLLAAVALVSGAGCSNRPVDAPKIQKFDTEYQVVVLANGQVLIGKLESLDSPYPVLRDVYSIKVVPANDPKNPQMTTNLLVSRSTEWHAPDFTVLNAHTILAVEPVTRGSRLETLIAENKKQAPAK